MILGSAQETSFPALHRVLARNVVNLPYIDAAIQNLLDGSDPASKSGKWFRSNLRKWLIEKAPVERTIDTPAALADEFPGTGLGTDAPEWARKAIEQNQPLYKVRIDTSLSRQIQHVRDYLQSPDAPTDLTRLSVPDAFQAADDWNKKAMKAQDEAKVLEGTVEVKKYPDGFRWVKLMNAQALAVESDRMRHCVGKGGYTNRVLDGTVEIYSLRDADDKPHTTIEWRPGSQTVAQIKGEYQLKRGTQDEWISNGPVMPEYQKYVREFLDTDLKDAKSWHDMEHAGLYLLGESPNTKRYSAEEIAPNPKLLVQLGEMHPDALVNDFGMMLLAGPSGKKKAYKIEEIQRKPKLLQQLVAKGLSPAAAASLKIEGTDLVMFGEHVFDFRQSLEKLGAEIDLPEEDTAGDNAVDTIHMQHESPEYLIGGIKTKHPKTYKFLDQLLDKLATELDDGSPHGAWFYNHEDELPPGLWDAIFRGIERGWRDGTYVQYIKMVQEVLEKAQDNNYPEGQGASILEEKDKYYLIIPIGTFLKEMAQNDSYNLDLEFNTRNWSYNSDYDSDSAAEGFYEELPRELTKD